MIEQSTEQNVAQQSTDLVPVNAGPKTLCNACGVKRQRVKRMRQQEAERMQQAAASRHDHGQRGPWQMRIQEVQIYQSRVCHYEI